MGTRAKVAVVCGAIAIVLVDVVSLATSDHAYQSATTLAANIVTGSVYVVTGLIAARKRPESRVGLLLGIAGLLYLAAMLNQSDVALIYTIGWLPYWIAMAVIGHIIITFPSGRIRAWTEGVIVGSNYVNGIVLTFVSLLFWSERVTFGCTTCPSNLLMVSNDPALADRIGGLATWLGVATAVASVGILTYRWWRATHAGRRVYGPALWVGLLLTVEYILVVGFFQDWLSPTSRFFWVDQALTAAYPIAFLVGLLRTRMTRSAMGDLVIELGRGTMPVGGLRDALAERLGDPSLQLAYAVDEAGGWVDGDGHQIELPPEGSGEIATLLELEGEPIAALIHDEALLNDPALVEAVASAARLAVTNERLQARVRAQLELARASRDRVVQAGDEARRRLERDLHDGAQQRLVSLSLLLGLAEKEIATGDGAEGARLLEEARTEAQEAIVELRSLARGIHPAILTDAGIGPAVRSLVNRSQIPVHIGALPERRFPPTIEATAYFVIAEALTNAAKHSGGSQAIVQVDVHGDRLIVDIVDNGVGGADPHGSGIGGLLDRAAAAGGTITLDSEHGAGTHLRLELPCG